MNIIESTTTFDQISSEIEKLVKALLVLAEPHFKVRNVCSAINCSTVNLTRENPFGKFDIIFQEFDIERNTFCIPQDNILIMIRTCHRNAVAGNANRDPEGKGESQFLELSICPIRVVSEQDQEKIPEVFIGHCLFLARYCFNGGQVARALWYNNIPVDSFAHPEDKTIAPVARYFAELLSEIVEKGISFYKVLPDFM